MGDIEQLIRGMFEDIDRSNWNKWLSLTGFNIEESEQVYFKDWIGGVIFEYIQTTHMIKNKITTRKKMVSEITKIKNQLKQAHDIISRDSVGIVLVKTYFYKECNGIKSKETPKEIIAMVSAIKEMKKLCDFALKEDFPSSIFTNENNVTMAKISTKRLYLSRLLVDWKYLTGDFPNDSITSNFILFASELMADLKQDVNNKDSKNAMRSLARECIRDLKDESFHTDLLTNRPYKLPQFKLL